MLFSSRCSVHLVDLRDVFSDRPDVSYLVVDLMYVICVVALRDVL